MSATARAIQNALKGVAQTALDRDLTQQRSIHGELFLATTTKIKGSYSATPPLHCKTLKTQVKPKFSNEARSKTMGRGRIFTGQNGTVRQSSGTKRRKRPRAVMLMLRTVSSVPARTEESKSAPRLLMELRGCCTPAASARPGDWRARASASRLTSPGAAAPPV